MAAAAPAGASLAQVDATAPATLMNANLTFYGNKITFSLIKSGAAAGSTFVQASGFLYGENQLYCSASTIYGTAISTMKNLNQEAFEKQMKAAFTDKVIGKDVFYYVTKQTEGLALHITKMQAAISLTFS